MKFSDEHIIQLKQFLQEEESKKNRAMIPSESRISTLSKSIFEEHKKDVVKLEENVKK
jgi:hypothetical protein